MFFDFGWSEILLIGAVALIVIGPKDLPRAMRIAGYWLKKARSLSQEFQNTVEEAIREADLDDTRKELGNTSQFELASETGLIEADDQPELPFYGPEPEETAESAEAAADQLELPGLGTPETVAPEPELLLPRPEPAVAGEIAAHKA